MNWLYFALLAPFFWAFSNFIAKYSLERYVKGIFDFMFFSTTTSWFFFFGLVWVFGFPTVTIYSTLPVLLGMALIYSYGFYGKALAEGETSKLVILFQGIPVLTLIFGILFLGQNLTSIEWIAFALVLLGGTIVSVEKLQGGLLMVKGLRWMIVAIIMWSIIFLLVDFAMGYMTFWEFFILDTLGTALAGIPLLLYPPAREQIIEGFKTSVPAKYGWFILNNFLDFLGQMSIKKAISLAPAVGLVTVAIQIQSVYIVVLGIILTLIVPHKIKEDISQKNIIQKLIGATIIFIGIYVLFI